MTPLMERLSPEIDAAETFPPCPIRSPHIRITPRKSLIRSIISQQNGSIVQIHLHGFQCILHTDPNKFARSVPLYTFVARARGGVAISIRCKRLQNAWSRLRRVLTKPLREPSECAEGHCISPARSRPRPGIIFGGVDVNQDGRCVHIHIVDLLCVVVQEISRRGGGM